MKNMREFAWRAVQSISVMFAGYAFVWIVWMACAGRWVAARPVASMLLTACLFGGMQQVCFGGAFFRRWSYGARWLLYAAVTMPLMGILAWAFEWIPGGSLRDWAVLYAAAMGVLAAVTLVFELSFRRQGRRYDGLLGQYRARRAGEAEKK